MKQTILAIIFLASMGFLTACGGGGEGSESNDSDQSVAAGKANQAASSSVLYDKEIRKQVCDILTPSLVAEVTGVDESALTQRSMGGMCLYTWDGGQASLGHLRTSDTVEWARDSFENSYRTQSGEEVKAQMDKIQAQVETKSSDGETDVDPEQAKAVTGAMASTFAGGFQYEDVSGLGDAASFETTRTETKIGGKVYVAYPNSLNVLTGNLKYTVSFNLDGEPQLYRDHNIALARAVLENLPD